MLKEQISADLKTAMKAGDTLARDTLRMLDSMIKNEEISSGNREEGLNDDGVIGLVKRAIKQRTEAAKQYTDAGRPELAESELSEVKIIETYLPTQMSDEDLRDALESVVAEVGAKDSGDLGKVMGAAMKSVGDGADGSRVRAMILQILGD